MDRKGRGSIAVAVLLILLGAAWLATQLFPDLQIWENIS